MSKDQKNNIETFEFKYQGPELLKRIIIEIDKLVGKGYYIIDTTIPFSLWRIFQSEMKTKNSLSQLIDINAGPIFRDDSGSQSIKIRTKKI